jgi:ubiquinone/menaquinone biosynthesis C-methylase UbiE
LIQIAWKTDEGKLRFMKDLYEKFAYDYDEFGPIDEYLGDEKTFLNKIFTKNGVNDVLDCACGTGQHIFMLAQSGYNMRGSDYSRSMLEVAHRNLQKRNYDIPLYQCDFRYLEQKFDMTFDAIVCLTTALPHLHTDEDLLTALKSMKSRLNKNGLLVLTQGTTHFTLTLPSIEVVVNRPDFSRIFVKEHDDQFQTIHILDLFHSLNRLESNQYDIVYRILLDEDYKRLLSQAGFPNIHCYGDYDMNEYNKNSKRLIVVADA